MYKQEGYDFMGAAFEVLQRTGIRHGRIDLPTESGNRDDDANIAICQQGRTRGVLQERPTGDEIRARSTRYDQIVVELKAVKEVCSEHEAQLFNYMRIARKRVGYLLNYGKAGGLQWKRFILDDLKRRVSLEH